MSQCCLSYLDAAAAGHLQCLKGLSEAGRFLPLDSPERASAGEVRKLEFWEAANASCRADHAHMLAWLLAGGWPTSIDVALAWHMGDIVQRLEDSFDEDWAIPRAEDWAQQFIPELNLYRHALQKPTPACLEALLDAGCRSVWICRFAALGRKEAFLRLAVNRGCPCDMIAFIMAARSGNVSLLDATLSLRTHRTGRLLSVDRMGFWGSISDPELGAAACAVFEAASRGDATILSAILERCRALVAWGSMGLECASSVAARNGHLDCLPILCRPRYSDMNILPVARYAAKGAQIECLKYILALALDVEPLLWQLEPDLLKFAAQAKDDPPGANLACMEFLVRSGFGWNLHGEELISAGSSPRALRYCLEQTPVRPWRYAMNRAIGAGSLECMKLLYEDGYERHQRKPEDHPALEVIRRVVLRYPRPLDPQVSLACLRLAVERSGPPHPQFLCTAMAVEGGEAFLRYVRELGASFSVHTTVAAAEEKSADILRYLVKSRAPWDGWAFIAAIFSTRRLSQSEMAAPPSASLECLQILHEHALALGSVEWCKGPPEGAFASIWSKWGAGPTLAVLRYVCDHMGPTWADPLLEFTARKLARRALDGKGQPVPSVDWQTVLYLARKLKQGLPHPLGKLVEARRAGAAALAGVFFKAGRLAQERRHSRCVASWGAMSRVPAELRERIAFLAHLVIV